MKILQILPMVLLLVTTGFAQNWEIGTDFNLATPTDGMARTMNNAFGVGVNMAKNLEAPFAIGAEMAFGTYASITTPQQYIFEDGTITETDVVVSNNIFNLQATGKYFLRSKKKFNPYLSGKLGWTWFTTNLSIMDPEDESACHPLESDILSRDNTYLASIGAGFRIDLSTFFGRIDSQRLCFDLSVHGLQGGSVSYMNTALDQAQPAPDRDVTTKFLNTQTQVIHTHHVGYVYRSVVSMVEYRFGLTCRPGWR